MTKRFFNPRNPYLIQQGFADDPSMMTPDQVQAAMARQFGPAPIGSQALTLAQFNGASGVPAVSMGRQEINPPQSLLERQIAAYNRPARPAVSEPSLGEQFDTMFGAPQRHAGMPAGRGKPPPQSFPATAMQTAAPVAGPVAQAMLPQQTPTPPATAVKRQPQPGEGARQQGQSGATPISPVDTDSLNSAIFDNANQTHAANALTMESMAPIDPVAPAKEPGVLERLGDGFSKLTTPGENGLSPIEQMAPWLSLISDNEAKWLQDPSAGRQGFGQFGENMAANTQTGRNRLRENNSDAMQKEQFGWALEAAGFAKEERGQTRADWERKAQTFRDFDTWVASQPQERQANLKLLGPERAIALFEQDKRAFINAGDGAVYNPVTGDFKVYDPEARALGQRATQAQINAANRSGGEKPLSDPQARQFRNDYERAVDPYRQVMNNLGRLGEGDTLKNIIDAGGRKPQAWGRVDDSALLFTVARAIQGAGVLTDSDIATLSGRDRAALQSQIDGWITGRQSLSPQQRFQMARIAQRGVDSARAQVWRTYDEHASFAQERNQRPEALGIQNPEFARPGERDPNAPLPNVDTRAVAALRLSPSAENKANFERHFNLPPGSADRYIGGRDITRGR